MKALLLVLALVVGGCAASTREKSIATTLTAVDVAAQGLEAYDRPHELALLEESTSQEEFDHKLAAYHEKRERARSAIDGAYRAVAAAAALNNDPSLVSMLSAAALVQQELRDLGVIK